MLNKPLFAALSFVAVVAVLSGAPAVLACDGHGGATASNVAKSAPKSLTVAELAVKLKAAQEHKGTLAVFDANGTELRASQGVIPTAVLLPSAKSYDLTLLPKDKAAPVVFYCAAEKCGASTQAAMRAIDAGHQDVAVLPAGIMGWVKDGQAVSKLTNS